MGKAVPIVEQLFSNRMPKEIEKKIASPENLTTERMSSTTSVLWQAVMPDWGTNPAKGLFFARFEYIRDSPTTRQSGITDDRFGSYAF